MNKALKNNIRKVREHEDGLIKIEQFVFFLEKIQKECTLSVTHFIIEVHALK